MLNPLLIMKNSQYLFLFGLSLLIISCSKDDESTSLTEANLIGVWKMTENYTKDGKVTQTTIEGVTFNGSVSLSGNRTYIFTNTPKKLTVKGVFTAMIIVNTSHSETKETASYIKLNTLSWSLQDNILYTTTKQGEISKSEVVSFDGNTIQLAQNLKDIDILPRWSNFKFTGSQHMTLVKQ